MIAPKQITLTIDGKRCTGDLGQTILQVAAANEIDIPTLCYLKHLSPWGGCRMCVVEILGSPKIVPSCTTPATEGSTVITNSPRLQHSRRLTLELLFSERNHVCPICPVNKGDCDLQRQGYRNGIDTIRYPHLYPALPVDVSGRYFGIDHNRCILCTRCVRTCDEIEGVHTLDIGNRGVKNQIVVDLKAEFGASTTCTLCGACVSSCPTGALFDKFSAFRGQLSSCQAVKTTCSECPVGCGLVVYTRENRVVDVFGDPESEVSHGHLCVRGRYETWTTQRERITEPMIRSGGTLQPVSWDEAIQDVREAATKAAKGQNALLLSPRVTNETVEAVLKLVNQFDRVCTFVGKNEHALLSDPQFPEGGIQRLGDADAIIVLGGQPTREHGVIAAKIRTTVRKKGAKLILLQTHKSDLEAYADLSVPVISLDNALWERVAGLLSRSHRPALVYGSDAMTGVGVSVLEKLIEIMKAKTNGHAPLLIGLPKSSNGLGLAAAGVEPLEEIAPWLTASPLSYLHIVASDEPDGGERLLNEKYVRALLQQIDCVVVQAAYRSPLSDLATIVLPAAIWCEKTGTVTNLEGRNLPLRAALPPRGLAREDKAILEALTA